MTLYKKERKRIGYGHRGVMMLGMFFYMMDLQGRSSINHTKVINGFLVEENIEPMSMLSIIGIAFMLATFGYFYDKMFWVNEQGKRILVMRKYEIAPVTRKDVYRTEIRIMLETAAWMLMWMLLIYLMITMASGYPISITKMIADTAILTVIFLSIIAVILALAAWKDYRTRAR